MRHTLKKTLSFTVYKPWTTYRWTIPIQLAWWWTLFIFIFHIQRKSVNDFSAQRWHQDFPAGGAEGHSILASMAVGESRKNKGGSAGRHHSPSELPLKGGCKNVWTIKQSRKNELQQRKNVLSFLTMPAAWKISLETFVWCCTSVKKTPTFKFCCQCSLGVLSQNTYILCPLVTQPDMHCVRRRTEAMARSRICVDVLAMAI